MQQLLLIAGGGALGSVFRYLMSTSTYNILGREFPHGTLIVNVIGSLLIGLFFILIVERGVLAAEWRQFLIVGFLGAFTTFSTFSLETIALFESGDITRGILNIVLSVFVCLLATWAGLQLGKMVL